MSKSTALLGLSILALLAARPTAAPGATLTGGNILVSAGNNSSPANRLYEYTRAGTLVQTFIVPSPNTSDQNLRDIAVATDGRVYINNGDFSPYLTVLTPSTFAYSHYQGVGFSNVGNVTHGGAAVVGNYAFVSDQNTAGSTASGIVRFNTTDFSSQRFQSAKEFERVSVGADGYLYALRGTFSLGNDGVEVYDPVTMNLVRTVIFTGHDIRAVAATGAGDIFAAGWDGVIYHYDAAGAVVGSRPTGLGNVYDIDLAPDGKLVASDWGHVILTDTALASQTTLTLPNTGPLFVAFTSPVPEPATTAALALAALLPLARRRR